MVSWFWIPVAFTLGGFIGAAATSFWIMTEGLGREVELQKALQANKVQES
jgi:hypothetical protein